MTISNQGEKLLLLVKRDSRSVDEISTAMGITSTYLPKLYKKQILSRGVILAAAQTFNVSESYFGNSPDILQETSPDYRTPTEAELVEKDRLAAEVSKQKALIEKLIEEGRKKDALNQELTEALLRALKDRK